MKILGIIPARYASTRFPAKPLADVGGKSMIRRVYEQALKASSLRKVVIATDHPDIAKEADSFGGNVCMTREDHISGTDRCFEALSLQSEKYDYVINIQGDEPFIQPGQIDLLASLFDGNSEIATLVRKINDNQTIFNPNVVKAVTGNGRAFYFSRSAIPHLRGVPADEWHQHHSFFKHIGMYGYRADILGKITELQPGILEKAESLEQLRWLENGFSISVAETLEESIGIDTPEDLEKALAFLTKHNQ